jgi:hypothetical protein
MDFDPIQSDSDIDPFLAAKGEKNSAIGASGDVTRRPDRPSPPMEPPKPEPPKPTE